MNEPLTAAGAALVNDPEAGHEETCDTWRQRGCDCGFRYTVAAIENEAAARAVDEALSVVKEWLVTIGVDIDGNRCLCESRYAPWDGIHRPDCMWERAAALVAHVRGS